MNPIKVVKIRPNAMLPVYGSEEAAGADLYACLDSDLTVQPGQSVFVPTGLSMELPRGYAGLVYARSGLACKQGLAPANKVGVIDSDYRGELMVVLHNHSDQTRIVHHADRIAQLVITPVYTPGFVQVASLSDTERSDGGFGSTGI